MTIIEFIQSLSNSEAPLGLTVHQQALWYDGKGDWQKAHTLVQDLQDEKAAWIHAYLHCREGDLFNADYWYQRAGRSRPECSLNAEWEELVRALL